MIEVVDVLKHHGVMAIEGISFFALIKSGEIMRPKGELAILKLEAVGPSLAEAPNPVAFEGGMEFRVQKRKHSCLF